MYSHTRAILQHFDHLRLFFQISASLPLADLYKKVLLSVSQHCSGLLDTDMMIYEAYDHSYASYIIISVSILSVKETSYTAEKDFLCGRFFG